MALLSVKTMAPAEFADTVSALISLGASAPPGQPEAASAATNVATSPTAHTLPAEAGVAEIRPIVRSVARRIERRTSFIRPDPYAGRGTPDRRSTDTE